MTPWEGGRPLHRLWYDTFAPTLAGAPDEVAKAAFDTGREVGEAVRRRYPGGLRVGHDHRHLEQALEETRRLIASGAAPALFEAAFEHRGVLVRADVLERLPEGGWRLLEIKSGTRMKDPFLLDVALQLWVLRGAGLDVRDAAVLTLNRDYVFDGAHLDFEALFTAHPVFGKRCERTTLVFSLTPGRSSRAGVRGYAIAGGRRRSSPACS